MCLNCEDKKKKNRTRQEVWNDLEKFVEEKGGKLLSDISVYTNSVDTIVNVCCEHGHKWSSPVYRFVNQKKWCKDCHIAQKSSNLRNYEVWNKLEKIVEEKGGKLLTPKSTYENNKTVVKLRCKHGHKWSTAISVIVYQKCWCLECSKLQQEKRKTKQETWNDLEKIVEGKGGKLLSDISIYVSAAKTKVQVVCEHGHKWSSVIKSINKGKWCSDCKGGVAKPAETVKKIYDIIKLKGGEIVGKFEAEDYKNKYTDFKIKCSCGNEWLSNWGKLNRGSWCPVCAPKSGGAKKTNTHNSWGQLEEVVKLKNGTILDDKSIYKGASHTFPRIKCNVCGTVWKPVLKNITLINHWCPECSKGLGQRLVCSIISIANGVPFYSYKPEWNINPKTNRRMEIDIYHHLCNYGFEYDGRQHTKPIKYSSRQTDNEFLQKYNDMKNRDIQKDLNCKKNNYRLYRVDEPKHSARYYSFNEFLEYINSQLLPQGYDLEKFITPEKLIRMEKSHNDILNNKI